MRYSDGNITIDDFDYEKIEIEDMNEATELFDFVANKLKDKFTERNPDVNPNYINIMYDHSNNGCICDCNSRDGNAYSW